MNASARFNANTSTRFFKTSSKPVFEFDPIVCARSIENSYRDYLATTIHFDDADLQAQLEDILAEPRFLAKGPFLEAAHPYRQAASVRDLVEQGVLCRDMLGLGNGDVCVFDPDRPLYTHQEQAIRKAIAGRNYAVVTGTGSGKTEAFLYPIVNDILTEFEQSGPKPGVRALIMYPMNALANDQLKRLRSLLAGTGITFGRYTGETREGAADALGRWNKENPKQVKLPNEIISREEMRATPPNILLTNYSMLEYLLLRPGDQELFGQAFGSSWRHIAIDEAHIYAGAKGTEIAFLLRRLKARIAQATGLVPHLHCYATSATIGSPESMPDVARFASDLFGEPFSADSNDLDVITSQRNSPVDALADEPWGELPLEVWPRLRTILQECADDAAQGPDGEMRELLRRVLEDSTPADQLASLDNAASAYLGLGQILLGEKSTGKLVRRMSADLLDLTNPGTMATIGIEGLTGADGDVEVLSSMVEVLDAAQRSEDVPILASRYHEFIRGPEGIFINLRDRCLVSRKVTTEVSPEGYEVPIWEACVCRHCGQAYVLGTQQSCMDDKGRMLGEWLSPKNDVKDEEDLDECEYFRLLNSAADCDKEEGEKLLWLCPICGTLHPERDGGPHRFEHEECARIPLGLHKPVNRVASKKNSAACHRCGNTGQGTVQSMRVSPEAAASVACYGLVREVPPMPRPDGGEGAKASFGRNRAAKRRAGSVVCFSDKRQDAAYFAPVLERTYGKITRRQMICQAVEAQSVGNGGCSPAEVVNWIKSEGSERYTGMFTPGEERQQAIAWVIDELTAEDARNSLEGLGVVRVEPTKFMRALKGEDMCEALAEMVVEPLHDLGHAWLDVADARLFSCVCLDIMRSHGAIEVPAGVGECRNNLNKLMNYVQSGEAGSGERTKNTVNFVGTGKGRENKQSAFVRKYAKRVHGVEMDRAEARDVLRALFDFMGAYLTSGALNPSCGQQSMEEPDRFTLDMNMWTLYPHRDDDIVYCCDKCGCMTHLDTAGVCMAHGCTGHMQATTYGAVYQKDRYYKDVYQAEALPIKISEHTAQLSGDMARAVQKRFVEGNVNVLSCTTTFELGVDVGDLRAVFMRNVPPSVANYTQRAGRVGRRAGKPGFSLTFCRLRPHDVAFFEHPERIIAGETRAPSCYLGNDEIARRHVFAVVFSEFFRRMAQGLDEGQKGYEADYNRFMKLADAEPKGLQELRAYLAGKPREVVDQLAIVFEGNDELAARLGIADWGWVDSLVAPLDNGTPGRLVRTHELLHADYNRLSRQIDEANAVAQRGPRDNLIHERDALTDGRTIDVLAENGILPKYGFPTDVVELYLPQQRALGDTYKLRLQRGLRQAISEYATGAEVVANGCTWSSVGVRTSGNRDLVTRRYGWCGECGALVMAAGAGETSECPVCGHNVKLPFTMLEPEFGFVGKKEVKGIVTRKPRSCGYAATFFSRKWPSEAEWVEHPMDGGRVIARYAGNGTLYALNTNKGKPFKICPSCGVTAGADGKLNHKPDCARRNQQRVELTDALGTSFVSDVLGLELHVDGLELGSEEDQRDAWESTTWAVLAAAAHLLDIPETELGSTFYKNVGRVWTVMLFDDVPGGAGHARRLSTMVDELLREAYRIVAECECSEDTCCCGCIANYYNQARQAHLSRGAAKQILGKLLYPQA